MGAYSTWRNSLQFLMEVGPTVAGHRGRDPLWAGVWSTTGQQTHRAHTHTLLRVNPVGMCFGDNLIHCVSGAGRTHGLHFEFDILPLGDELMC